MSNNGGKSRCRFLELPGELRNSIYEETLEESEVTIKNAHSLPGLVKTCRVIYSDTIDLYYSSTTFSLVRGYWSPLECRLPTRYLPLVPLFRYKTNLHDLSEGDSQNTPSLRRSLLRGAHEARRELIVYKEMAAEKIETLWFFEEESIVRYTKLSEIDLEKEDQLAKNRGWM